MCVMWFSVSGKQHGVHDASVAIVTVRWQSISCDWFTSETVVTAHRWSGAVW